MDSYDTETDPCEEWQFERGQKGIAKLSFREGSLEDEHLLNAKQYERWRPRDIDSDRLRKARAKGSHRGSD
jgi:hypothetical protein